MVETRVLNAEHTIIGDFKDGKWLDVTKHYDIDFNGIEKSFWRVDTGSETISTLNRTKKEAMEDARKYLKKWL